MLFEHCGRGMFETLRVSVDEWLVREVGVASEQRRALRVWQPEDGSWRRGLRHDKLLTGSLINLIKAFPFVHFVLVHETQQ